MDFDYDFSEGLNQFYLVKENQIKVSTIIKRFKKLNMLLCSV